MASLFSFFENRPGAAIAAPRYGSETAVLIIPKKKHNFIMLCIARFTILSTPYQNSNQDFRNRQNPKCYTGIKKIEIQHNR